MKKIKCCSAGFICEECLIVFPKIRSLTTHIQFKHNTKEYFDKWLKDDNDSKCKICGNTTEFISSVRGYKTCCCDKHRYEHSHILRKKLSLIKYGVEFSWQRDDVKKKINQTDLKNHGGVLSAATQECKDKVKQTKLKNHGDENYVNIKKSKQTKLKNHGNENYTNREKAAITNLKKYGNISPLHGTEQIKKKKETWLLKYGTENPNQNINQYNKSLKTRRLIHRFLNTDLTYQGSYELDFLNIFHDKLDIQNGPSIKYKVEDKNKVYHSDFYIPSLNLIIEIKSSWTLKLDVDIEEKKKATIANKFNYILIIDKKYNQFKQFYAKNISN